MSDEFAQELLEIQLKKKTSKFPEYPLEFSRPLEELYKVRKNGELIETPDAYKSPLENLLQLRPEEFEGSLKTYIQRRQEFVYKIRDLQKKGQKIPVYSENLAEVLGMKEELARLRRIAEERLYDEIDWGFSISKYLSELLERFFKPEADGFYTPEEQNPWIDKFYLEPKKFMQVLSAFIGRARKAKTEKKETISWQGIKPFREAILTIPRFHPQVYFEPEISAARFEFLRTEAIKLLESFQGIQNGKDEFESLILTLEQLGFEKRYGQAEYFLRENKYLAEYSRIARELLEYGLGEKSKEDLLSELLSLDERRQEESLKGRVLLGGKAVPIFLFFSEVSEFLRKEIESLPEYKLEILDLQDQDLPEIKPEDLEEV